MERKHTIVHYLLTVIWQLLKGLMLSAIWILIALSGYLIFNSHRSPFDLIIGLPLILLGLGFVVHNLWSALLAIFSPAFNRGICQWCTK